MVCCNQPMSLCTENTVDASVEKHVPFIEKIPGGYKVTIGSTIHPMDDDHYIEWIQIIADGKSYRQYLSPGDEPVAVFMIEAEKVTAQNIVISMVFGRQRGEDSDDEKELSFQKQAIR